MKIWYVTKCEKLTNYIGSETQYEIKDGDYGKVVVFPEYDNNSIPVALNFEDLGMDSFYLVTLKSLQHDFEILRISSKLLDIEEFPPKPRETKSLSPGESIFDNLILY